MQEKSEKFLKSICNSHNFSQKYTFLLNSELLYALVGVFDMHNIIKSAVPRILTELQVKIFVPQYIYYT